MNGWVPLSLAAVVARRPVRTVRTWVSDPSSVRSACRVKDRRLLVWWPDVHAKTEAASRRLRGAA